MKRLLKILLPPFIAFTVFFIAVRYSPFYFKLRPDEMGDGDLQSFMSYYRYLLPLCFVTAIFTQILIFIPIWNRVINKSVRAKVITFLAFCLVCLILSACIAYAMWDNFSRTHLEKLCLFMTAVQVAYWVMNIAVMYFLDRGQALLGDTETTAS
jgi:hypothetical protein